MRRKLKPRKSTARAAPARPIAPTVGAVALKDGFTNTLGMKFAHVTGTKVLFCIHETRYKDYAAYAAEVPVWTAPGMTRARRLYAHAACR